MRHLAALSLLLLLALAAAPRAHAQLDHGGQLVEGSPEWQTFEEAMAAAKESDKMILVDIYAPWCGYCRKMQRETYVDDEVKAYLKQHFEIARLNGDDQETQISYKEYELSSAELAQGFGATGFPTTVFLNADSEYITRLPGLVPADTFLQILTYIGSGAYETQTFEEFAAGD